jgi:deuterolysin
VVERTVLQSGCSTAQKTATTKALANCKALANSAATAALSGSSTKFSECTQFISFHNPEIPAQKEAPLTIRSVDFKTTSSTTRTTVSNRLKAVATECGSITSGKTTYYCTDVYGYCESNVLAYTIPSQNVIVNCPLYYSALPALTGSCHAQDQATTTLHEMTHAPGVYSPGTQDNGYGYAAATSLSSSAAVLNADSYALFANGMLFSFSQA